MSLVESDDYEHFFFVTNTALESGEVVIFYEKCDNNENYIKAAYYDMAVGLFAKVILGHWGCFSAYDAWFQYIFTVWVWFLKLSIIQA